MRETVRIESEIAGILSAHGEAPVIVRRDGSPLSVNEKHCLVLQPEAYRVQSPGAEILKAYLGELESKDARDAFWEALRKNVHHPMVPFFFIAQGRMVHLLEWILDELDQSPFEEGLIVMASNALKVGHERYSVDELEKIGDLITTLMTQAHVASGHRSLAAQRGGEDEISPETMQAMRLKRDIYKALGILQEVARAALYRKLEGMLTDS